MGKKGFTLVELVIVITILSILCTISFISFQSYTKNARDSIYITDFYNLNNEINLIKIKAGSGNLNNLDEFNNKFSEEFTYDNNLKCYSYLSSYFCDSEKDKLLYLFTFLENKDNFHGNNINLLNDEFYPHKDAINFKLKKYEYIGSGSFILNINNYINRNSGKIYINELESINKKDYLKKLIIGQRIDNISNCIIMGFKKDNNKEYLYTNDECDYKKLLNMESIEITYKNGINQVNNESSGGLVVAQVDEKEYSRIDELIKKTTKIEIITYIALFLSIIGLMPLVSNLLGYDFSGESFKKDIKFRKKIIGIIILIIIIGIVIYFI